MEQFWLSALASSDLRQQVRSRNLEQMYRTSKKEREIEAKELQDCGLRLRGFLLRLYDPS